MCGRYASTRGRQELVDFFGVEVDEADHLEPDYNVAPTKPVPVVLTRQEDIRELHVARWGLVPFWAKDVSVGARMINARVETAHEKPAFRRAFSLRRCIVPADGYYEWQANEDGGKQPHFIRPADGGVLAMAGLYEVWRSPDAAGGRLLSCTILTTEATDDVGRIHDRMPMLVEPGRFGAWLDPALTDADEVRSLLVRAAEGRLESHPVSTAVNKVANNGPELVRPLPQEGINPPSPFTLF
jgi:putative SOS response-associated peptidase YedK